MKKQLNNLALIGGDNDLPLFAYNSLKKKYKNFIYINLSISNKEKLLNKKNVYNLKLFELEKCIDLLSSKKINNLCFLGAINRPDFSKLKLDKVLSKYINNLITASKEGDGKILSSVIDIFQTEGFSTKSFTDHFPNEYLFDKNYLDINSNEKKDITKGVALLNTLSSYDNAQACVISNGYILSIEAAEGTDKMLSRIKSIKNKISRNIVEGCLVKIPKVQQNLNIDLPTVGINTLELMFKNKLNVLAVSKQKTIVVEKDKFYKTLIKYNIKLYFID
jgi:DUF1009 family protein